MLASNGITFTAEATGEDAARILSAMKSVTEWTFEDKGDGTVEIHAKTEDSNSRDICRRLFCLCGRGEGNFEHDFKESQSGGCIY